MRDDIECRFCEIKRRQSDRMIADRERVVVIFSDPSLMPGHLLVIPKKHALHLTELSAEERKELFDVVIEFQDKILNNVASGCDIRQNDRPFLSEDRLKVDHVHFHLQPREFEDKLYKESQIHETKIFDPLSPDEVKKYRELLM